MTDTSLTLDDYLKSHYIDPNKLALGEKKLYKHWQYLFEQLHPNSFYEQKRFLINQYRRTYPLISENRQNKRK